MSAPLRDRRGRFWRPSRVEQILTLGTIALVVTSPLLVCIAYRLAH